MTIAMRAGKVATIAVAEPGDGGVAPGWVGEEGDGVPPLVGGVGVVPDEGGVGEGGVDEGGVGEGGVDEEDVGTLMVSFWPPDWQWDETVHMK